MGKRRRYIIDAGILAAVFLAAIVIFSYVTNRDNTNDMLADMGTASRPQVSFSCNGNSVNTLPVYAKEMEITAVRDTITPVSSGQLELRLKAYDNSVQSLDYTVYTLDGKQKLLESTVKQPQESTILTLDAEDLLAEERALEIVLNMDEGKKAYLYTRIVDSAGTNVFECLDYIRSFHEDALSKAEGTATQTAIEADGSIDNTTFSHVTIHSDFDHVSWGELEPAVEGSELWSIKEINSTYTSVQLQYRVRCKGEENETDVYSVTEFFRVRHIPDGDTDYLLDYDRTMAQVFDPSYQVLTSEGVILGITDGDVSYLANEDGTIVSFVQARELWNYNKESDSLSLVFSFADAENSDTRNLFPQHAVKLLQMDDKGNTVFAVYGYMNRGEHEGEVGIAVYYYDTEQNTVEEKVFVSSTHSYERVLYELGDLAYYSADNNVLYLLADGTLYEVDADNGNKTELAAGLADSQYVTSADGTLIAYQEQADGSGKNTVTIKNFSTGEEYTTEGGADEIVTPLGFMDNDFVYGVSRREDAGQTASGQETAPMYKVEIEDDTGKTVKTYEQEGIYILGAELEDSLITLNRATRDGSTYTGTAEDYITNNEKKGTGKIEAEVYVTELKETQTRLAFKNAIKNLKPDLLKPKQILRGSADSIEPITFEDESTHDKCYVYGYGGLRGIYDSAGGAIAAADEYSGVVVSARQTYIWQRGNRDLEYSISGKDAEIETIRARLNGGEAAVDIMEDLSGGQSIDLTGCDAEQLLYIVNQDIPVIAMLDTKNAVIITGYGDGFITYRDSEGGSGTVSYAQMNTMTEGSGHAYVGYAR